MAYNRRGGDEGRVVGFKDGMPVYKKSNGERRSGERRTDDRNSSRRSERRSEHRSEHRSEGRNNEGERYGRRGDGDTYNRKEDPREGRYRRDDGYRPSYREATRGEGGRGGRSEHYSRPERPYGRPDFGNENLNRHAEEAMRVKPRKELKKYDNLKPLPRDIPEEPREEAELPNIIMGRNPVKEAIKAGRSIDRILVTSEHDGSLNEILDLAYEAKLVVRNVERSKLDEICMPFGHNGRTGNHQGIIAYVPGVEYCELDDILAAAEEKGEAVLLDGIEDPHNLGSIIRSAECAGAHGVVITKRRSASVTAAVVKTSAGATEHMRIAKVVNLPVAIERLKSAGVWVAAADMGGEPMYKADLKGPFALVVGAEGAGVSRLVREKCDYVVSIPLKGELESLNASVAAAVIMFEKVRQEME